MTDLTRSRDETRQLLDERIHGGQVLLGRVISTEDELKKLGQDTKVWHEYNTQLLQTLFVDPEESDNCSPSAWCESVGKCSLMGVPTRCTTTNLVEHDSARASASAPRALAAAPR